MPHATAAIAKWIPAQEIAAVWEDPVRCRSAPEIVFVPAAATWPHVKVVVLA